MSTPDPRTPAPPTPSGTDGFFDSVRRAGLLRTRERWIGGVSGGIALRLGIDPLLVRGLFLASVLLGGLGLVLYAVGWLLLPEQEDGRIHLQELFRGHADIAVLGAALLLVSGLTTTGGFVPGWYGGDSGWWRGLVWLGVIVTVVALLASRRNRRPGHGPTTSLPGNPPPPGWRGGPVPPAGAPTGTTAGATAAGTTPAAGGSGRPYGPTPWTSAAPTEGPSMSATPTAPGHPSAPAQPGAPGQGAGYPDDGRPSAGSGQTWTGSGQTWTGYGQTWTAPRGVPTTTLPPAAPRGPRGAGRGTFGIVVALTLLVLAGLLYADRLGRLAAPVGLLTIAAAVVFLGVAIVVAGLRGRTAGGLGTLAVVLMLIAAPLAASDRYDWRGGTGQVAFGDITERPLTVAEAEQGYELGAGTARIDLTALPSTSGEVSVPIDVAAGDVTVLVPRGADVTATIDLAAGELTWFGERTDRFGADATTLVRPGSDTTGPDLELDISMGVGSLTVLEAGR